MWDFVTDTLAIRTNIIPARIRTDPRSLNTSLPLLDKICSHERLSDTPKLLLLLLAGSAVPTYSAANEQVKDRRNDKRYLTFFRTRNTHLQQCRSSPDPECSFQIKLFNLDSAVCNVYTFAALNVMRVSRFISPFLDYRLRRKDALLWRCIRKYRHKKAGKPSLILEPYRPI